MDMGGDGSAGGLYGIGFVDFRSNYMLIRPMEGIPLEYAY
jgi:hypothetical protein